MSKPDARQDNATAWLEEAVRDATYVLKRTPDQLAGLDDLSPSELAKALLSVEEVERDTRPAPLLPPRLPLDVRPLQALSTVQGIQETCEQIMSGSKGVHPAVVHAILAHALHFEDDEVRKTAVGSMESLFKGQKASIRGNYYQPTVFQISMLYPEWFPGEKNIRPTIRGGQPPKESHQGMMSTLALVKNRLRVNAADLLTQPRVVNLKTALLTESAASWSNTAEEGFSGPNPLASSLWAMGFGDKEMFWDWMTPGAALFSPFYSNGEIDALLANAVAATQPGYYLRMGAGIADIFPFHRDALLASQVNVAPLLDAPLSFGTLLSIRSMMADPGCPLTLSKEWAEKQYERFVVAQALDMIPMYSAFHGENSAAPKLLEKMANEGVRQELFLEMLKEISICQAQAVGADAGISIAFASPTFEFGSRATRNERNMAIQPPPVPEPERRHGGEMDLSELGL